MSISMQTKQSFIYILTTFSPPLPLARWENKRQTLPKAKSFSLHKQIIVEETGS